MHKTNLSAVYDDDLEKLLSKLKLLDKLHQGQLKCKFTDTIITFDNLYSIFPESGSIKLVCDSPDAVKLFADYLNEHSNEFKKVQS